MPNAFESRGTDGLQEVRDGIHQFVDGTRANNIRFPSPTSDAVIETFYPSWGTGVYRVTLFEDRLIRISFSNQAQEFASSLEGQFRVAEDVAALLDDAKETLLLSDVRSRRKTGNPGKWVGKNQRKLLVAAFEAPIEGLIRGPRPAIGFLHREEGYEGKVGPMLTAGVQAAVKSLIEKGYMENLKRGPHGLRRLGITQKGRSIAAQILAKQVTAA